MIHLFVKLAGVPLLHNLQKALNLVTLSEIGIKFNISPKGFLWKSPSNPTIIKFFLFISTDFKVNSYKSLKN